MRKKLPILALLTIIFASAACSHKQQSEAKLSAADSLINATFDVEDYERVLTLCDSLQQQGDISLIKAASERAWVYYYTDQPKLYENELRQVLAETPTNAQDSLEYFSATSRMADILHGKGNLEEALQLDLSALAGLQKMDQENPSEEYTKKLMRLTARLGKIQMTLGMKDDAAKMFEASYGYVLRTPLEAPVEYKRRFTALFGIMTSYFEYGDYVSAEKWLQRQDSVTAMVKEGRGLSPADSDYVMGRSYLSHACVAQGLNRTEEFTRSIAAYKATQSAKSSAGHNILAKILLNAQRYAEAADEFAVLDQYFADFGLDYTLGNLSMVGDKFMANYKAGRRDTALAVAALVFEKLDSAITKQKNSDAAELATIYETHQKDAEIAQQQIKLTQQRLWGMLLAIVLLTAFFIVYTLNRVRHAKRLAEMKAAQERIESELRIARNIQMSMVPSVFPPFPERKDIDLFASMTPAKEVGGDLYDFFLNDSCLYFALGDVSGKGIPASLFMTQATRLFRTLASEGLKPEELATRMNSGLCEGNNTMMFVTMFLGVINLDTGLLEFCNCGHNPPVLDDSFLELKHNNRPLGLFDKFPFQGESIDDIRGKKLLLYTDGLNEAMNPAHQQFGDERIIDIIAKNQDKTACQVIKILKAAVEQHRNGAEPNDDLTMLCISITPESWSASACA